MASGDTLFVLQPHGSSPPYDATPAAASLDEISDASSPDIVIPVLDFDGSTDEHADWIVTIPSNYAGTTGFTFSYKYALSGTDGSDVEMEFRVLDVDDGDVLTGDLGIDGKTAVTITDSPDSTANKINYSTTGALAKASFDSAAAGDLIVIRATRDIDGAESNTDDLQLIEVLVKET